jgi:hypothetical protein
MYFDLHLLPNSIAIFDLARTYSDRYNDAFNDAIVSHDHTSSRLCPLVSSIEMPAPHFLFLLAPSTSPD